MLKDIYIFGITLVVGLTSCYTPRYAYSPAAANVPELAKKGDSKLGGYYSSNLSPHSYGFDLQGAYAVGKHIALQSSYSYRHEENSGGFDFNGFDSSVIRYRRYTTEFGAGYFAADNNQKLLYQVFGGVGFGKFRFTDNGRDISNNIYHRFHQSSVTKIYLQPALTAKIGRNFAVSFASRFSLVSYHDVETDYSAVEQDNYKLDSLTYSAHLFWEPVIQNSFGFKQLPGVRIEYQFGLALLETKRFIDYRSFNFSIGMMFDLPVLLKRKGKT